MPFACPCVAVDVAIARLVVFEVKEDEIRPIDLGRADLNVLEKARATAKIAIKVAAVLKGN